MLVSFDNCSGHHRLIRLIPSRNNKSQPMPSKFQQQLSVIFIYHIGSSGQFLFTNLTSGTYTLKVVASNGQGDRSVERRNLVVSSEPYCAAHLINSGVSVRGNRATIEFTTTDEPAVSFSCTVDNERTFPCE